MRPCSEILLLGPAIRRYVKLSDDKTHQRYICVLDPANAWMVWDCETNMPASLGGRPLTGRPKDRADAARAVLERIHKGNADRG